MKITRKDFIALAVGTAAGCTLPPRNSGGRRWYKGMIHAHTCWSDGYALPEQAVAVYKNSGYDFFSITDHNRIGSDPDRWIRVAPLDGTWPPKTVTFGKGEPVLASYRLADDDLYVRARVESDEATTYPNAKDRMHPLIKVAWTQPYRR